MNTNNGGSVNRSALPALKQVKPHTLVSAAEVEAVERQVAEVVELVDDIETLTEWQAKARAWEMYLRGKELQKPMLGAQRRVEARIGQLLGPAPGRGHPEESQHADSLHRQIREEFRILAHALDGDCAVSGDEWRKSRRALVSLLRKRMGLLPETPDLPPGKYRCIVADPPWQLDTGPDVFGGTGERGHDNLEYEQMSVEDIKALPVVEHAADDSHLYLWTTNRYVEAAYDVARSWGFKPSVLLVWAKQPRGVGLGDAYRLTTEFVLYARRGHLDELDRVDRSWFNWPRGTHSEKPDEFFQMVESMTPAPGAAKDRLEMFARSERDGWTVWGVDPGLGDVG